MVKKKKNTSMKNKKSTSTKKFTKNKTLLKKRIARKKRLISAKCNKNTPCIYSHADVDKLLDSTPKFSKFYHWMTVLVYIGIMVIIWGFVYYAYSIDKSIYYLYCNNCGKITANIIKTIITLWLFALYFYFLCELRCRAWDLCLFTDKSSIRKTNKWILAMSVLFTGLTSMFFWF